MAKPDILSKAQSCHSQIDSRTRLFPGKNITSAESVFEAIPTTSPLLRIRERCSWPSSGPGSLWPRQRAAFECRKTLQWCWTAVCSEGLCNWPAWETDRGKDRELLVEICSVETLMFFYFTQSKIQLHQVSLPPRTLNCSLGKDSFIFPDLRTTPRDSLEEEEQPHQILGHFLLISWGLQAAGPKLIS